MAKRKLGLWVCVIIITFLLAILGFRFIAGYYPLSDLFYKIHYANLNKKERLDDIVIDKDFKFHERHYSISKEITSHYHLPHFLILRFEGNIAPLVIESNVSIELKVFRKGKLVYSTVTTGGENLFQRDTKGKPLGVSALSITEIPFPLAWKVYENITFEITVLEADEELHEYIDRASLLLFPNIML